MSCEATQRIKGTKLDTPNHLSDKNIQHITSTSTHALYTLPNHSLIVEGEYDENEVNNLLRIVGCPIPVEMRGTEGGVMLRFGSSVDRTVAMDAITRQGRNCIPSLRTISSQSLNSDTVGRANREPFSDMSNPVSPSYHMDANLEEFAVSDYLMRSKKSSSSHQDLWDYGNMMPLRTSCDHSHYPVHNGCYVETGDVSLYHSANRSRTIAETASLLSHPSGEMNDATIRVQSCLSHHMDMYHPSPLAIARHNDSVSRANNCMGMANNSANDASTLLRHSAVSGSHSLTNASFSCHNETDTYPRRDIETDLSQREQLDVVRKYTCKYDILMSNNKEFGVARRLIGTKGINMKKIVAVSGAKLRLRGTGSGYLEGIEKKESSEPLHICVSCTDREGYLIACDLVEKLMQDVFTDYVKWLTSKGRLCELDTNAAFPKKREHFIYAKGDGCGERGSNFDETPSRRVSTPVRSLSSKTGANSLMNSNVRGGEVYANCSPNFGAYHSERSANRDANNGLYRYQREHFQQNLMPNYGSECSQEYFDEARKSSQQRNWHQDFNLTGANASNFHPTNNGECSQQQFAVQPNQNIPSVYWANFSPSPQLPPGLQSTPPMANANNASTNNSNSSYQSFSPAVVVSPWGEERENANSRGHNYPANCSANWNTHQNPAQHSIATHQNFFHNNSLSSPLLSTSNFAVHSHPAPSNQQSNYYISPWSPLLPLHQNLTNSSQKIQ